MIARTEGGREAPPDRWCAALLARVPGRPAPAFVLGRASDGRREAMPFGRMLRRGCLTAPTR